MIHLCFDLSFDNYTEGMFLVNFSFDLLLKINKIKTADN